MNHGIKATDILIVRWCKATIRRAIKSGGALPGHSHDENRCQNRRQFRETWTDNQPLVQQSGLRSSQTQNHSIIGLIVRHPSV